MGRKDTMLAFLKKHWLKFVIGLTAVLVLGGICTAGYFGWQKVKQWRAAKSQHAQQVTQASTTPEKPAQSGLEERFDELNERLARVERERDESHRRELEKDEQLIVAASQLDRQNRRLERSAQVRRPTRTTGSERVTSEPDHAPSRHETQILEYVWTTRNQVGSISLLPGEAATVRIMGGVKFVVDPDPGLDIMVVLEGNTPPVPFAEWQKNPSPVRRFEISNNGDEGKVALFVPNN